MAAAADSYRLFASNAKPPRYTDSSIGVSVIALWNDWFSSADDAAFVGNGDAPIMAAPRDNPNPTPGNVASIPACGSISDGRCQPIGDTNGAVALVTGVTSVMVGAPAITLLPTRRSLVPCAPGPVTCKFVGNAIAP